MTTLLAGLAKFLLGHQVLLPLFGGAQCPAYLLVAVAFLISLPVMIVTGLGALAMGLRYPPRRAQARLGAAVIVALAWLVSAAALWPYAADLQSFCAGVSPGERSP